MNEQIHFFKQKLAYETDSWDLYESLEKGEKIKVIDARSGEAYRLEHIPDAISLPHREMSENSTQSFDKDFTFVCYCDGIGCNASTKGALNMAELGFMEKELMGGLDCWKRDGYQTEGTNGKAGREIICGC
jgi:rhodanese-related sulfurtransferase